MTRGTRLRARLVGALWPLALAAAVLIAFAGARSQRVDAQASGIGPVHGFAPPLTTVPEVAGLPIGRARARLTRAGLSVKVRRRRAPRAPRGTVVASEPPAPTRLPRGSTVLLTVSSGPPLRRAPAVQGYQVHIAQRELARDGYAAAVVVRESRFPTGTVVRQSPEPGAWVRPGSTISLFVAIPSTRLALARVVGRDMVDAARELWSLGLEVRFAYRRVRPPVPDGEVLAQSPRPGTSVRRGSRVRLVIARR
jgi:beta-lactam-binding protein with PASTA domain